MRHRCTTYLQLFLLLAGICMLCACSSTKFVPQNGLLLDDVKVKVNDSTGTFSNTQLMAYVRMRPNNKFFKLAKLRLGVYNLSGRDSTRWYNKWIRRLGEPPVIFDSTAAENDALSLLRAVNNAGFLKASVSTDSFPNHHSRKTRIEYKVETGLPHIVNHIEFNFHNDTIRDLVMKDSAWCIIAPGDRLDRNQLELQRDLITGRLQNSGYWAFSKDQITFVADTTEGSRLVDLTLNVLPPKNQSTNSLSSLASRKYIVRNVIYIPDYNAANTPNPQEYKATDIVERDGITILYGEQQYLRPSVLVENCFIRPGKEYHVNDINNTYASLGRLSILKFINIRSVPVGSIGSEGLLDIYILLSPNKSQFFSVELEGTNSEGDFGVAVAAAYTHRNIGNGSETFNTRLRGAYQALNGNWDGFIHNRMMEYGVDMSLTFPKFKAPFLRENFKRRIKASTEISLSINYQERPEYTRIISAAGWNYKWTQRNNSYRYTFTPIDISYVYLPASTNNFIDQIAPDNPLLRYSYEDHFIMRAGFNFYHTTKKPQTPWNRDSQRNIMTFRVNSEIAGNFLFLLNSIFTKRKNFHQSPYKVFGIHYSQFVRIDGDYTFLHSFDKRNSLAIHVGFGIGVPYGNSSILPFEKRFYGGGANGVRGWDVRTLGPGRYPASNSQSDFINQCGDIRFILSTEYRVKLFWVVEGALFIDGGNIWTIRSYETQPYGVFKFNNFYKELAAAYGVGLRFDFNYFLIRFDMGMKAHNPAINSEPWPLIHPRWRRDHSFHFSIGYPF